VRELTEAIAAASSTLSISTCRLQCSHQAVARRPWLTTRTRCVSTVIRVLLFLFKPPPKSEAVIRPADAVVVTCASCPNQTVGIQSAPQRVFRAAHLSAPIDRTADNNPEAVQKSLNAA